MVEVYFHEFLQEERISLKVFLPIIALKANPIDQLIIQEKTKICEEKQELMKVK